MRLQVEGTNDFIDVPNDATPEEIAGAMNQAFPNQPQWKDTGKNIPSSAGNFVKNIASAIGGIIPRETTTPTGETVYQFPTIRNLGDLVLGEGQKLIGNAANVISPGSYDPNNPPLAEADRVATNVNEGMTNRYGGLENIKKTIITDPVGAMADLSTLLGLGGGALKAGGLAKSGEVALKASELANPLTAITAPIKSGARALAESRLPEYMYKSAGKFKTGKTFSVARRDADVSTGLNEGIQLNKSGLNKLDDKISNIEDSIQEPINQASANGVRINNANVADKLIDTSGKYKHQARPQNDLNAIEKGGSEFLESHPIDIDIADAQLAKKGTYQKLKGEYGKQNSRPNVEVDIDKSLARGLKDEVYDNLLDTHPELKNLGEKEGSLISLRESVEGAVKRIENRNLFSLMHGVLPAAGGAIAGRGGAWTALGAAILDQPGVKSNLAIALNKAKGMDRISNTGTPYTNTAYQMGNINQYSGLKKLLGIEK